MFIRLRRSCGGKLRHKESAGSRRGAGVRIVHRWFATSPPEQRGRTRTRSLWDSEASLARHRWEAVCTGSRYRSNQSSTSHDGVNVGRNTERPSAAQDEFRIQSAGGTVPDGWRRGGQDASDDGMTGSRRILAACSSSRRRPEEIHRASLDRTVFRYGIEFLDHWPTGPRYRSSQSSTSRATWLRCCPMM